MRTWCQSIENLGAPPWCEKLYFILTWGFDVHQVFAYLIEEILHKILLKNTIPFLEELTLDISYVFLDLVVEIPGNLNLEKFILNVVTENGCFNGLLQKLSQIAPNFKKLVINNFCGVWDMDEYQYNLNLTVCSLETLKINVLPVKQKTEQCVEQGNTTQADGFFVLYAHLKSKIYPYTKCLLISQDSTELIKVNCNVTLFKVKTAFL